MANTPTKAPAPAAGKAPAPVAGKDAKLPAPAAAAAKVKAPKKELTPEQIALKAKLDAARAEFNKSIGKEGKKGGTRTSTPSYGGFNPEATVTLVDGNVPGFASDADKAIKAKIPAGGIALKALLELESFGWFVSRLSRGSFKVNGMSLADAFTKK